MPKISPKPRGPRNRTITLSPAEIQLLKGRLITLSTSSSEKEIENRTISQDLFSAIPFLPHHFVDLLFLDPPYNLNKKFQNSSFKKRSTEQYLAWFESWAIPLLPVLKQTASIYICGDWHSAAAIQLFSEKHLRLRNRITWEREKGRGAVANWKNCSEDIWFCTRSDNYHFDTEKVKLKKRVIAPYRQNGVPKDWEETAEGGFRLTCPSNLWTDISVPFWSMSENTDHPTQKPEKLLAKLILASSRPGDLVMDPFSGSGTCCVVAKKLGRRYVGIEINQEYACVAEKRLLAAAQNQTIQGYSAGVFWERNSAPYQNRTIGECPVR